MIYELIGNFIGAFFFTWLFAWPVGKILKKIGIRHWEIISFAASTLFLAFLLSSVDENMPISLILTKCSIAIIGGILGYKFISQSNKNEKDI